MNTKEREKIRRTLFKQEKQKEKEEKLKYPALNGYINDKNIFDFFIFDDDEANNDDIDKNNQMNYELDSYITSERLPDLYTPYGMIKGDCYKLISPQKNNYENKERKIINNDNNKKENFIENKKIIRYFDIITNEDINNNNNSNIDDKNVNNNINDKNKTNNKSHSNDDDKTKDIVSHSRCKKCGEYDHLKCDCTSNLLFCYICLGKDHVKKNCPKYKRCFKCLKYGHKLQDCREILNSKCENCHISIHKKEECMKVPNKIILEDLKENNLKCEFCKSREHLVCPFYNREDIILKNENEDKILNNLDCSKKIYCHNCGENHLRKDCPEKKENRSYSENTEKKTINNDSINAIEDDKWGNDEEILDKKNNPINTEKSGGNMKKNLNNYKSTINYKLFESWGEEENNKSDDIKNNFSNSNLNSKSSKNKFINNDSFNNKFNTNIKHKTNFWDNNNSSYSKSNSKNKNKKNDNKNNNYNNYNNENNQNNNK